MGLTELDRQTGSKMENIKLKNVTEMDIHINQGVWRYEIKAGEVKEFPDYLVPVFLKTWPHHVILESQLEEYLAKTERISEPVSNPVDEEIDIDDGSEDEETVDPEGSIDDEEVVITKKRGKK